MTRLARLARDPYAMSVVVLALLGIGGVVGIALGAVGIAGADTLDLQLPYLASGGLGGLAALIVAAGLYDAQRGRLARARQREAMDGVLANAADVLAEVRDRPARTRKAKR
jgi:hypothetical protein